MCVDTGAETQHILIHVLYLLWSGVEGKPKRRDVSGTSAVIRREDGSGKMPVGP